MKGDEGDGISFIQLIFDEAIARRMQEQSMAKHEVSFSSNKDLDASKLNAEMEL